MAQSQVGESSAVAYSKQRGPGHRCRNGAQRAPRPYNGHCGHLPCRVTTGGMIMAASAGERVFAMSSTQLQPFANALLARYPRWVSAARYAVTFIPFALWARALRRRASQDAGGAPEKPAVRFGAGVLRGKDVATLVMVAVGLHDLSALIATMVGAAMPWLLESYGKIVDQSGLEAYGADWFLSLIFGAPVVEETIFRGLGLGYLRASGMRRGLANGIQALSLAYFTETCFRRSTQRFLVCFWAISAVDTTRSRHRCWFMPW